MTNIEPGLIALILITAMLIAASAQIIISHKYTEHFESFLPTSRLVSDNIKNYQHAGLLGKTIRTGQIATLLAIPKIFIYRGYAEIEEGRRQKLSATPDQSGTVCLCLITNSVLKNASPSSLASFRG